MTLTLVLPESLAATVEAAAQEGLETAGVILATYTAAPDGDLRLLGRQIKMVGDEAYFERHEDHLSIASSGYVAALGDAERLGAVPIWFHTHPGQHGVPLCNDNYCVRRASITMASGF
jgi:proteasome lid subunit RPN8/RPN11